MLILGTSGSGKGVLMNQLVRQINRRKYKQRTGERAIFYDLKGEFIAKQMQKGDLIFCPFDSRSLRWNIFNEIESLPDFDVLSKSLFAPRSGIGADWQNAAADLFRTGRWSSNAGNDTNNDLWEFFRSRSGRKSLLTLPLAERARSAHRQR